MPASAFADVSGGVYPRHFTTFRDDSCDKCRLWRCCCL